MKKPRSAYLPLEGYRIIDLTQVWAGPQACGILADMGAEVVRIESAAGTDTLRLPSKPKSPRRQALERQWFHRDRRYYIALNLKKPRGVELLKDVVRDSDALVTNLPPRVLRDLDIQYETLRPFNESLVMVCLSAAGLDGPYHDLSAYGPAINCAVGTESLTGYPDDERPNLHVWDPDPGMAGMLIAPLCMALFHRRRTGEGQLIDLAFTEFLGSFLGEAIVEYQMTGRVPGPRGNRHPTMAPHEIYRSAGDDAWVSIAVGTEQEWEGLCRAIGRPEMVHDPRFTDVARRRQHRAALDRIIEAWTAQRDPVMAAATLQAEGVAAAPVRTAADIHADAHTQHLLSLANVEVEGLPKEDFTYGLPWRLSDTPGSIRRLAQPIGADSQKFFTSVLKMAPEEFERLVQAEVIY